MRTTLVVVTGLVLAPPAAAAPAIHAHRGGALAFGAPVVPENSMPAFRYAAEIGGRDGFWLEPDAVVSSDGVPFVIHDSTLDRTTDCSGNVLDTPAAVRGRPRSPPCAGTSGCRRAASRPRPSSRRPTASGSRSSRTRSTPPTRFVLRPQPASTRGAARLEIQRRTLTQVLRRGGIAVRLVAGRAARARVTFRLGRLVVARGVIGIGGRGRRELLAQLTTHGRRALARRRAARLTAAAVIDGRRAGVRTLTLRRL